MKGIFVSTIGFIVALGMIARALPAAAADAALAASGVTAPSESATMPASAAALTAEETEILRQSIAILGTMVRNLNSRVAAEDGSMANAQEIGASLAAIATSLNQINAMLAAISPRAPVVAKNSAPAPAAEKPMPAPVPQPAAPMPVVAQNDTGSLTPAANGNSAYSESPAAPVNGGNDQVAQTGSIFTGRKILGIVIILAAVIGTILFLRRKDQNELTVIKAPSSTNI